MQSPELDQLVQLLSSMLSKPALRKNVYLFNALTPQLTLPLRVLARQRRVAQITQDHSLLIKALTKCPHAKMSTHQEVRLLVAGDLLMVRVSSNKKVGRRELSALTKQMKVQIKEEKNGSLLQFQSHAAAEEFVERVKAQQPELECELLEKDPYKCLEEAIAAHRREKKAEKAQMGEYGQPYFVQPYLMELAVRYPVFVRRAVDSQEQTEWGCLGTGEQKGCPGEETGLDRLSLE